MLRLDSTTRKLQLVLSGAVTTNQLPVMVSFSEQTPAAYSGLSQLSNSNSATAVDICAAPGASTIRDIDYINVFNADTVAATVTILYDDNATDYELITVTLAVGDHLIYTHGSGWQVMSSTGLRTMLTAQADSISFTPTGGIAATDVQTALAELDTDLSTHTLDTANPHGVTKSQVGLGSADNTSDTDKPVSTAQQTALNLKAPLASPTFTGTVTTSSKLIAGDPGTEATGIDINGVTYESTFKVSDIDGTNYAQTILHRHSTTLEPLIVGARSNSNTSAHAAVTAGQGLFTIFAAGHTGTHYDLFGSMTFSVGTGTVSGTSSPGKWTLSVTPNGSNIPVAAITVDSDASVLLAGALSAPTGAFDTQLRGGVAGTTGADYVRLLGTEAGAWLASTTAETVGVDETTNLATPGTFTGTVESFAGSNATLASVSGELEVTSTSAGGGGYRDFTATANQVHAITITMRRGTVSDGAVIRVYDGASFTTTLAYEINATTSNTTVTIYAKPTGTTLRVVCVASGAGLGTAYFDNLTVAKSGNLIGGGNMGALTPWTQLLGTHSIAGGRLRLTADGTNPGRDQQAITCAIGETYVLKYYKYNGTDTQSGIHIAITSGTTTGAVAGVVDATDGYGTLTFIATQTTHYILARGVTATAALYVEFDNISVRLATPDLTANNHGAEIHGQLTTTGADLQWWSGFTAYNYLEVPYDSDFDPGTGDFMFLQWVKMSANSANEFILQRANYTGAPYSGSIIDLFVSAAGLLTFRVSDDAGATYDTVVSTIAIDDSEPRLIGAGREGSNLVLYVDGALHASTPVSAAAASLTNTSARLRYGLATPGTVPFTHGYLALCSVIIGTVTASDIKDIYDYESGFAPAAIEASPVKAGFGTNAPTQLLDVNDTSARVRLPKTPASASAAGERGQIAWDSGYVYVCVAPDTWKRAALVSW